MVTLCMARDTAYGVDFLLSSAKVPGFTGESFPNGKMKLPLTHDNANTLRDLFPFTAPQRVLRKARTFGLGDRLDIATPGHIKLFEHYDAYPVFTQQSTSEYMLTGRNYEGVLDAATFAVYRENFQKEWGADADHLKTKEDVDYACRLGFTLITLDCSGHIKSWFNEMNSPPPPERLRAKYLGKQFSIGDGITLRFSEKQLKVIAANYGEAIDFAVDIYKRFLKDGRHHADFEIALDGAAAPTTPLQHYFVARELIDAGVSFATIAPRFSGDFQEGIDYIGDLAQFEQEIKTHAAIARHLHYKLSIHSGSDKFSIFPIIGKECRGIFHVKTAGANWLEAMRVITQVDPALYRKIHQYALAAFNEALKSYHLTADLTKLPDINAIADSLLPTLFENINLRQFIHITYGLFLDKKNIRDRLYQIWRKHEDAYAQALENHIGKHLDLLGVKKE